MQQVLRAGKHGVPSAGKENKQKINNKRTPRGDVEKLSYDLFSVLIG